MKQLTINGLIKELEKARDKYGGRKKMWYYVPDFNGTGINMPLEVESIKVLKRKDTNFAEDFIIIY